MNDRPTLWDKTVEEDFYMRVYIQEREIRKMECDVCGLTFKYSCLLKRHKIIHNITKDFSCNICSKRFKYPYSMTRHVEYFHNNHSNHDLIKDEKSQRNYQQKRYICIVCLRTFSTKGNLRRHRLRYCISKTSC